MSAAINQPIARSRVPNGVSPKRLRVALPQQLLDAIKQDADSERRTVSSKASLIIADYYAAKLKNIEADAATASTEV